MSAATPFRSVRRRPMRLAWLLALTVVLAACGRDEAHAPLAFAPAETPYVFGNLEPLPDAVIDSWSKLMTPVQEAYTAMLQTMRADLAGGDEDPEKTRRLLDLMTLFEDKLSLEGWERIGFTRHGRAALYGVGLMPVLRVELGDPEALRAFVAEVERRVETPAPVAEIDGHSYWRFTPEPDKPFAVIVAIIDKHLVVTIDAGEQAPPLSELLGLKAPSRSVLDTQELEQINRSNGFTPYGTLLLDSRRLVATLLGRDGEDTWLTRRLAEDGTALTPDCRREIAAMAEIMPRIVSGYTRVDAKHMNSNTVFELKPAIASALLAVAAPVPGLGDGSENAFDAGFGIKLDKLAEFIQAQAQAIRAEPYACEHFAHLNEGAAQTSQQVAGLYMAAGWFTGMRAVLSDIAWSGDSEKPERLEGALVIASPNPAGLIGMLKGFVPQLADLELTPGAPPKAMPEIDGQLGDLPPTYAAMTDQAIGLAFGQAAATDLPARLAAPAGQPAPLFHIGYSGAVYARFFKHMQALSTAHADDDEAETASADRLLEPMMASMYALYDAVAYIGMSMVITERGAEMRQTVRLN